MKVYVIMGNDFPDCVFTDEAKANAYVEQRKNEPGNKLQYGGYRIYWRVYDFVLTT